MRAVGDLLPGGGWLTILMNRINPVLFSAPQGRGLEYRLQGPHPQRDDQPNLDSWPWRAPRLCRPPQGSRTLPSGSRYVGPIGTLPAPPGISST